MTLKFYNTMTRKKEAFKPLRKGLVRIYSCGPTVYDYAHIGNFRAYMAADLVRRYLKYKGFRVKQVMNITDVDDKTIKGSRKEGIPLAEFTKKYEKAFFEDIDTLNIERVEKYPKATRHIKVMLALVKTLLRKGYAYKARDGVYYSISKFRDYGKLARLEKAQLKAGARVKQDLYDKEHARDFALWKLWDKEDGDVFWVEQFGKEKVKGRPGWHIECSAMSMKYLGKTFDIHTGGIDLIFPHHQNEIAQSEGATGKQFVRYWLHNEHLVIGGEKMSKSLGNFCTLRQLVDKKEKRPPKISHQLGDILDNEHESMVIRYLLLATHYRQKLNLTGTGLKHAKHALDRLREFVANARKGRDGKGVEALVKKAKADFEKSMDDDLNIPEALSVIFEFVRKANRLGAGKKALEQMLDFDKVLGLKLSKAIEWKTPEQAEPGIRKLILKREKLRKDKKFKESDKIRAGLRKKGIVLEDTKKGTGWKRIG